MSRVAVCGTQAHLRRGEATCKACRAGWLEYKRRRREFYRQIGLRCGLCGERRPSRFRVDRFLFACTGRVIAWCECGWPVRLHNAHLEEEDDD